MTRSPDLTRDQRKARARAAKYDLDPPVPSGTRGYWSQTERRKRARRHRRAGRERRLT